MSCRLAHTVLHAARAYYIMFLCIYIWTLRSMKSFVVVIIIIWYCLVWVRCVVEPLSVGDGLECCRHLVTRRLSIRRMVTLSSLLLKWKENCGNVVLHPFFIFLKNKLKFVKVVVFYSNSTFMETGSCETPCIVSSQIYIYVCTQI